MSPIEELPDDLCDVFVIDVDGVVHRAHVVG
jgi:hypothetical protein